MKSMFELIILVLWDEECLPDGDTRTLWLSPFPGRSVKGSALLLLDRNGDC